VYFLRERPERIDTVVGRRPRGYEPEAETTILEGVFLEVKWGATSAGASQWYSGAYLLSLAPAVQLGSIETAPVRLRRDIDGRELTREVEEFIAAHPGSDPFDVAEALRVPLMLAEEIAENLVVAGRLRRDLGD
jgi:hypothetical protein